MTLLVTDADDRAALSQLFGCSDPELRERDAVQPPIARWIAYSAGVPIGLVTVVRRADGRTFVTHRLAQEEAFEPLMRRVLADAHATLHLRVSSQDVGRRQTAELLGFTPTLDATSFAVPFEAALRATARFVRTSRVDLVTADEVDRDALFALDVALRNDVPGNDGWAGNRVWFDDELASPEFDPSGYLVARTPPTGELVGLVRFWRNPEGPALGMLGVSRDHRRGTVAIALLDAGLRAASGWGSDTFDTHTSRQPLQRRMYGLGATETGGFTRLTWQPG